MFLTTSAAVPKVLFYPYISGVGVFSTLKLWDGSGKKHQAEWDSIEITWDWVGLGWLGFCRTQLGGVSETHLSRLARIL